MPKSAENTVFVRFVPTPSQQVMRHQLEDIFSQIGPIKKSSWINSQQSKASRGYGFVKYVSQDDAEAATKDLHDTRIQMEGRQYTIKVELASMQPQEKGAKTQSPSEEIRQKESNQSENFDEEAMLKKKSRIIIRNLSFYAKEPQIRKVLEKKYGKVIDVHLPRVQSNLHVGFCFVTFANPSDATKAVNDKKIDIHKRTVSMDWSIPKRLHQQQKNEKSKETEPKHQKFDSENEASDSIDDAASDDETNDESSSGSEGGHHDNDVDSEGDSEDEDGSNSEDDDLSTEENPQDNSVSQKRTLFLRNLPFDTTRHDLFQLFAKFGYIQSIYLVKDRETRMLKGTAFVTYSKPQGAQRAVQSASQSSEPSSGETASAFVSQRQAAAGSENPANVNSQAVSTLLLRGRKIYVDFAVDKETAATFDSKEHNVPSADRRNMYLQSEARVESSSTEPNANNENTWDELPEQDQKKRQTALKDKTTKLQSPIFFINPYRLSFRNLAKHLDELGLQKLLETATKRGIEKGLVGAKDQIAHWRALGEMSTREILAKIQEKETAGEEVIEEWEEKSNIKEYIPSVYIDRDFGPNGKKTNAPSRGFGFAEFTHHTHALACLRELNNNPFYSRDFTAGGKVADALKKKSRKGKVKGMSGGDYIGEDGRVRVPRLIVDFAVENKVKAKKQKERRLQQQVNQSKQRLENLEKKTDGDKKKRSRGAIQRAKKKQKRDSGEEEEERQAKLMKKIHAEARKELKRQKREEIEAKRKIKSVKPPKKKKKADKEEQEFDEIVDTYRSKLEGSMDVQRGGSQGATKKKRWFD